MGDTEPQEKEIKKRLIPSRYGCEKKYFTSTSVPEKTTLGPGSDHRSNLPQVAIVYAKKKSVIKSAARELMAYSFSRSLIVC